MLTLEKKRLLVKLERWNFMVSILTLNVVTYILGNVLLDRIRKNSASTGTVILLFAYYIFICGIILVTWIALPIWYYVNFESLTTAMQIYLIGTFVILPMAYWTFGIPAISAIKYLFVDETTPNQP